MIVASIDSVFHTFAEVSRTKAHKQLAQLYIRAQLIYKYLGEIIEKHLKPALLKKSEFEYSFEEGDVFSGFGNSETRWDKKKIIEEIGLDNFLKIVDVNMGRSKETKIKGEPIYHLIVKYSKSIPSTKKIVKVKMKKRIDMYSLDIVDMESKTNE